MKQFLILAILATASLAAKVPMSGVTPSEHVAVPVKVTTPVPEPVVAVPVSVSQHEVPQKPVAVPPHVQHVVQTAHQHIQQVVNHHVGNKQKVPMPVGVSTPMPVVDVRTPDKVGAVPVAVPAPGSTPVQHHHHVHVDVVQHLADGHKHVAHNHVVAEGGDGVRPQHVIDKIQKVEKHVAQVMQHAQQHIPHVINHQIALKEKIKQQHAAGAVVVDKVPVSTTPQQQHVAHAVPHQQQQQHVPEVTVKTTTM